MGVSCICETLILVFLGIALHGLRLVKGEGAEERIVCGFFALRQLGPACATHGRRCGGEAEHNRQLAWK
jgi:hypothetical protein